MRNFAMGAAPVTWVPLNGAVRPTFTMLTGPYGSTIDGGEAYQWKGGAELQVLALDLASNPSAATGPLHFTVRVRPQASGTCLGLAVDPGWSPASQLNSTTPWMRSVTQSAQGRATCMVLDVNVWTVRSFTVPIQTSGYGIGSGGSGTARFALQAFSRSGNDADVAMALAMPIVVAQVGASWNQLAGASISAPPPAPLPPPPPAPPAPPAPPPPAPPPPPPPPPPAPVVFRCVNGTCVAPLPGRPGVPKSTCAKDCG